MRSRMLRRSLTVAVFLGLVVLAGLVLLPIIASTQIVRDHLALELSRWSGYRVTMAGRPVIRVWPNMQAVLSDVKFLERGSNGAPVVLSSDIVEIDLSAFAALRGRIEPQRVHFVRPVLRLRIEEGDYVFPSAASGRFRHAVSVARSLVAEQPDVIDGLPAEPVGVIELTEGRIVARQKEGDADTELLTSVSAVLQWPTMNRELNFKGGGIWRGENISMSGMMTAPLRVLSGADSPFQIALESAPLSGSFNGTLSQRELNGELSLASPSLGRTLEWLGTALGDKMPSGAVSMSGSVRGDLREMKIEKANLILGGSRGAGTLDFVLKDEVPAISGTLAFEDLDLVHLLTAYPIVPDDSLETHLGNLLNLDLRVSAARAVAGPLSLASVAAVVQLTDRLVTFDISDSVAFGGNVVAGIRIDRKAGSESAEFRLLANDIDGAALSVAAGSNPWVPEARGKLSVILKGPLAMPRSFVSQANGSISASFGAGTVGSIDLTSFIDRAVKGGFFSMDDVEEGSISFDRAEFKITMTDGVAAIEKAAIAAGGRLIEMGGIADYSESSIALTGKILPDTNGGLPVSFFAGGSWNSPYFSAILPARPAPLPD